MPFPSVLSFGIGSSVNFGMPQNEHFLPRNNESCSESIPRNFFGTKFRCQPKVGLSASQPAYLEVAGPVPQMTYPAEYARRHDFWRTVFFRPSVVETKLGSVQE
jgi:hypothetical protein